MDKIELAGYSAAGVCLVATLAVFFLWISPNSAKIETNLKGIATATKNLGEFTNDWHILADMPADKAPASVAEIEKLLDKVDATPRLMALAKSDRTFIAQQTNTLIKSVVSTHIVVPPAASNDKRHDLLPVYADIKKLFADNSLPPPDWHSLGMLAEDETNISDKDYATAMLCHDVLTQLFKATTDIQINHDIAADYQSLTNVPIKVPEKIDQVLQFYYFDTTGWEAHNKLVNTEIAKVARPTQSKDIVPDTTKSMHFKRTGFRLVFQTRPVNVDAALAALETIGNYLVTVKRLEVVRASTAYYTKADFNGQTIEVPQPYRDGKVQVTVDVELVAFDANPKADEELSKLVWSDSSK